MSAQPMPTPDVSWMDGKLAAQWVCVVEGGFPLAAVLAWTDADLATAIQVLRAVHARLPRPRLPGVTEALAHIAAKGFA